MEPVLSVEGAWFRYRDTWVLQDVTFQVHPGEILGILGPNASGKTTLVRVLDGNMKPQRGRVLLRGEDIRGLSRRRMAQKVAVVPQESPMLYPFTCLELALMGRHAHLGPLAFEGPRDVEIARRSLERTGSIHLAARKVNELSGGERQRVLIARALAQEPQILLLDEPTAFLDLRHQLDFVDLLLRLHRDEELTVVWVSHDLNLAALTCERLMLLKDGRIRSLGTPAEVLTEENVREVYGRRVLVDRNPRSQTPRITPIVDLERGPMEGSNCAGS
jgi:iron complex transport system ATP-binding protein